MEQSRLTKALDERFTEIEEIRDVADYGCSGGVSGFIYYHETRKFFNEYEEEIEQELWNMYGDNWFKDIASTASVTDTMQFKNHCVWLIVETYCIAKVEERAEALLNS